MKSNFNYCDDTNPTSTKIRHKIVAQTIFLGASVIDFNANTGWGEQPSTLTVNLVNDNSATGCLAMQHTGDIPDNSYYDFNNDSLYIKITSPTTFEPVNRQADDPILPGKVYYNTTYNNSHQVNQKWWQNKDPGFLGDNNNINTNGTVSYNPIEYANSGYNITNCPVYFKMGDFSFGGVVQSWKKNKGQSGDIYTVVVHSMQALLNNCTVILDRYAGSIAGRYTSFDWSAPSNYVGNKLTYNITNNDKGNIPNIFNVYGFLESFGPHYFGSSSYKKDDGFLCSEAILALRILTGVDNLNTRASPTHDDFGSKTAFSPYGRIIAPSVSKTDMSGEWYTSSEWGVIAPSSCPNWTGGYNRCHFKLDLSELEYAIRGSDKRIKADSMSISQFIDYVCDEHGLDWTTDLINTSDGWVIKIIAVSRRFAPTLNAVKSTVNKMICNKIDVGSFSYGKEKNDTPTRSLIIGAPQQRLYQVKNTRLAYTQSNHIFNPNISSFVDYYQAGRILLNALGTTINCQDNTGTRIAANLIPSPFHYGKIKFPAFFSTRNPAMDDRPTSLKNDEAVHTQIEGGNFTANDIVFEDYELDNMSKTKVRRGNYKKSELISHGTDLRYAINPCPNGPLTIQTNTTFYASEGPAITDKRFYPLYRDTICPFFGNILEDRYDTNASNKNTDFKRIRPVWYDFWTGQIVLLFHKDELPRTRINLRGRYTNYTMKRQSSFNIYYPKIETPTPANAVPNPPTPAITPPTQEEPYYTAEWFLVTENEIRAALAGSDSFLSYTLGKRFKTDLYIMMNNAYIERYKQGYIDEGKTEAQALKLAYDENNWHWNYYREGITGPEGNLTSPSSLASQSIQTLSPEARKDFDLLAEFIKNIGSEYYGKQYMVPAPYLQSKTEQSSYAYQLQTELGYFNVFKGGGEIRYNYEPCSAEDGAWEEPGNQIDDLMVAGDRYTTALSNDRGQLKPILGYNATMSFDYIGYQLQRIVFNKTNSFEESINPYFSYSAWDSISKFRRANRTDLTKYYFENINIQDLASNIGDFVIVTGYNTSTIINIWALRGPAFTGSAPIIAKDAFGINQGAPKRKLYKTCSVDNKFHFMDPERMSEPKMIVSTSFLGLNNSSEQYQLDPSNTVAATIGMEEFAIYTRAGGRNIEEYNKFYRLFTPYYNINGSLLPPELRDTENDLKDDTTPRNVKIAPKAIHPLFVGIPIKSNTYCYGPWTNYPALLPNSGLFATGTRYEITNIETSYNNCTGITTQYPTTDAKNKIIDNWVSDTKFEVVEDFAPWNFGGMRSLDESAMRYASGLCNFQTDIEIGSLEAVGTPLFKLGGAFNYDTLLENLSFLPNQTQNYTFWDVKTTSTNILPLPILTNIDNYNSLADPVYAQYSLLYKVPDIPIRDINNTRIRYDYYSDAPILTNIMTSMGQNGITTTYSFRTYTRKLSLFNRQDIERTKKLGQQNLQRKKEIAQLRQRITNNEFTDKEKIKREQFATTKDPPTLGTSPVTTIVCSAHKSLGQFDNMTQDTTFGSYSSPVALYGTSQPIVSYSGGGADDLSPVGHLGYTGFNALTAENQARFMFFEQRMVSRAQIYPDAELNDALSQSWGRASIMSLDGLFSPISFYPTVGKDTFSMSKYDQTMCPICGGTKGISREFKRYRTAGNSDSSKGYIDFCCDSCTRPYGKVNASTYFGSTTTSKDGEYFPPYIISSGQSLDELKKFNTFIFQRSIKDNTDRLGMSVTVPINISTLQPIVMPYHEFSNANAQRYSGEHPDGAHDALTTNGLARGFYDKGRNSISVIGKGSVFSDAMAHLHSATDIGTTGILSTQLTGTNSYIRNYDYDHYDSRFRTRMQNTDYSSFSGRDFEQNMRFVGFRGPMMMHGWGYDIEGYPVPNAADEPLDIDSYGRPKRFKTSRTVESTTVKYSSLGVGEAFCRDSANSISTETVKLHSLEIQNSTSYNRQGSYITDDTQVTKIIYKDDYNDVGGYDPAIYNGSIISKTQKYQNGRYTPKIKLKQFYLNWAERQDLWPVGPIDLRWDPDRKVWSANTQRIYKMVYVTLEEDMTKDPDLDESFPARGFLDDLEYSTQALPANKRRLVYVKDRSGYSAPRGARLYCRYDSDTGFYEPVSKQQFTVYGSIAAGGNTATVTMSYVQGKKRGESAPTMSIVFNNPLGFSTTGGAGMFSYINGEWTLISVR